MAATLSKYNVIMASEKTITVNDFNLFYELMKSAVKIVEAAKFQVSENGLAIYGARKPYARCELTTNAISSDESIEFSIADLQMFVKVLSTIKEVHDNDYSDFKFTVENEKVCFKSKKFKSKFQTQKESIIEKWLATKVQTKLNPVFEFTTTPDLIRRIRNHQFIFTDVSSMRIYLETKEDMENNVLFATVGNKQTSLNNEVTMKFGLVTYGALKDRSLILDVDRLNLLDAVQTNDIKVSLMDANVLVSDVTVKGKNDTFFNVKLYTSILKA